ncbi:hypothetical protein IW492_01840 [Enterococcus sp. BWB1-3]|uniref:hypothetical protein n=1 Tax=Enterococcus sp. BWB1-3 TaxID=2787713 RepID=UPI001923EF9A|nr:hypothetical protein [Enterococcus sp. BWB1-3]MBL1227970.1 hypothetical protein [Enterococcus sp. BWB1-3]
MKKIMLGFLTLGLMIGLAACNSSGGKTSAPSSVNETSETSTVDSVKNSSAIKDDNMEQLEKKLLDRGVEVRYNKVYLYLNREKGIDYEYFEMAFQFDTKANEIYEITLQLRGNIDGEDKDTLFYDVKTGRIVESTAWNTDISAIAEVLESLGCSDQELVEFAQWYYENNK